jgi:hypothetical protein
MVDYVLHGAKVMRGVHGFFVQYAGHPHMLAVPVIAAALNRAPWPRSLRRLQTGRASARPGGPNAMSSIEIFARTASGIGVEPWTLLRDA